MSDIKIFANPDCDEFFDAIREALKIENLIDPKLNLELDEEDTKKLKKYKDKTLANKYKRQCRIHFCGIAATVLLDKNKCFESFEAIFKRAKEINSHGIQIKIRILLLYPYAHSVGPIVQAEMTKNRSTINQSCIHPNYLQIDDIAHCHNSSNIFHYQKQSLNSLQDLIDEYPDWGTKLSPNSIRLRFSVLPPTIWSLVVNKSVFYEPYQLAREKRETTKFARYIPVIRIEQGQKLENQTDESHPFCCITDHFRYMWRHHTTLFSEDATEYVKNKPNTLSVVKKPDDIKYDEKAKWLNDRLKDNKKKINVSEEIVLWKKRVSIELRQMCQELKPISTEETLFISCSWNNKDINLDAKKIKEWLVTDFPTKDNVKVVKAEPGDLLHEVIYDGLEKATLAIVLLTNDIEAKNDGTWYTKPNIYHELGLLMQKLIFQNKASKKRLAILADNNVHIPSNIKGITNIPFDSKKVALTYPEILEWLGNIEDSNYSKYINKAANNHQKRISKLLDDEIIKLNDEGVAASQNKLMYLIEEYKTKTT